MKLTVAVFAIALVGGAGADEWRIDASSHRDFKRSLEAAKEQLSPENLEMRGGALKHIWNEGARAAEAADRRYSDKDYFRQIDGLTYEQVVHFTDETYAAALAHDAASNEGLAAPSARRRSAPFPHPPYSHPPTRQPGVNVDGTAILNKPSGY